MQNRVQVQAPTQPEAQWSTRLVLLSLAGIFFLTLIPFRFNFHATLPGHRSPFLLGGWGKDYTGFNAFLNLLLFVPFGFAVSRKCFENCKSRISTLIWAFILGASLSYSIEFLQIYVPSRDSGWGDITTNTAGSVVGFLFYVLCGAAVVRVLSGCESFLASFLVWPKFAVIIPLYLAFWLAISIPLQKQTRLDNWDPSPLLLIGNDASGEYDAAWTGDVYSLQLWDRPLSAAEAEQVTVLKHPHLGQPGLLAAYDFSAALPLQDQMNFLPQLSLVSKSDRGVFRESAAASSVLFDGSYWLTSGTPVTNLVMALQKTNQFTIRVVCRRTDSPARPPRSFRSPAGLASRILSLRRMIPI